MQNIFIIHHAVLCIGPIKLKVAERVVHFYVCYTGVCGASKPHLVLDTLFKVISSFLHA